MSRKRGCANVVLGRLTTFMLPSNGSSWPRYSKRCCSTPIPVWDATSSKNVNTLRGMKRVRGRLISFYISTLILGFNIYFNNVNSLILPLVSFIVIKSRTVYTLPDPWCTCADLRVIVVNVDAVSHGLLQREEVNWLSLQDVCGGCKELIKTPTPLLVSLHYTS